MIHPEAYKLHLLAWLMTDATRHQAATNFALNCTDA
jgi:hypothetical protein